MESIQVKTEPFEEVFVPGTVEHASVKQEEPVVDESTPVRRKRRPKNLQCEVCKVKYIDMEMIVWHSENCHSADAIVKVVKGGKKPQYQCNLCQTMYDDVYQLIRHNRYQHKIDKLPFPCGTCKKTFAERKNQIKHRGICKNVNKSCVRTEKCEHCDNVFVHVEMLRWHVENFHGENPTLRSIKLAGENKYQCVFCKLDYRDLQMAIAHLRANHQVKKLPFKCIYCPRQFVTRSQKLKHHPRCEKNKESPKHRRRENVQQTCEEMFTTKIEIQEHPVKPEPDEQDYQLLDMKPSLETILPECRVLVPKLLQCDSCSFCTDNKSQLESHMQTHHTSSAFKRRLLDVQCADCGIMYSHPEMMVWHSQHFHGSDAIAKVKRNKINFSFQCTLCQNVEFFKTIDIIRHLRQQHRVSKLPFQCKVCDRTYECITNLERHICRVGQKNVPTGIQCKLCNQEFDSETQVKQHVVFFHIRKPQHYQCSYCDESFCNSLSKLFSHCHSKHPGLQVIQCHTCGTGFTAHSSYCVHKKYAHSGTKFTCNVCSATFSSPGTLQQHMATLHSREKWSCNFCSMTFKCKIYLSLHIRNIHTGTVFQCQSCEFKTRKRYYFVRHLRLKHSSLSKAEICQICNAKFKSKKSLQNHVDKSHTSPVFHCQYCDYAAHTKNTLKNHFKMKHLFIPPDQTLQCTFCSAKFKHEQYLNQHVNDVHTARKYQGKNSRIVAI